jgi:hypothetical protein
MTTAKHSALFGHPDESLPHRFPFYYLNIDTGALRLIRGTRCDKTHVIHLPYPPPKLRELSETKATNPKAYYAELERLYAPHRESGAFAHLFTTSVRTCMFCRSRKGRKVEALARCDCFEPAANELYAPMVHKLKDSIDDIRAAGRDISFRLNNPPEKPIVDLAIQLGYVPRFTSYSHNCDQVLHIIKVSAPVTRRGETVLALYHSVIKDMTSLRMTRKVHLTVILSKRLAQCGYFDTHRSAAAVAAAD